MEEVEIKRQLGLKFKASFLMKLINMRNNACRLRAIYKLHQ